MKRCIKTGEFELHIINSYYYNNFQNLIIKNPLLDDCVFVYGLYSRRSFLNIKDKARYSRVKEDRSYMEMSKIAKTVNLE